VIILAEKWDGVAFMKKQLELIDNLWVENIRGTKFFQATTFDLPHMEPRLRHAFMDTFCVTMMGFWNLSIIMQGVLLEILVKEIIFAKEHQDFQRPFGDAIIRCEQRGYLDAKEISFLKDFKNQFRNPYQHSDIKQIAGNKKATTWTIPIEKGKEAESILKGIEKVRKGEAGPGELKGYQDVRAVGTVIKIEIDKEQALPLFCKVEEFVRNLSIKHFNP